MRKRKLEEVADTEAGEIRKQELATHCGNRWKKQKRVALVDDTETKKLGIFKGIGCVMS